MKLTRLLFLAGMFIGCINVNAQTEEQKKQTAPQQTAPQQTVNPKLKEKALKAKANRPKARSAQSTQGVENKGNINSTGLNEDDPYQGRTVEFLSLMVVDKIPADFPKYQKGTGVKYYNDIVENYFRQHLDLLKDKPKQKLSRH